MGIEVLAHDILSYNNGLVRHNTEKVAKIIHSYMESNK